MQCMTCSTFAVSWPRSISWLRMSCARDSPINAGSATSRSASTSDNSSSSSSLGTSAHRQPWSCERTWSGNLHQDATVRRSKDPPVWACPHTFQVCLQVQSRAHLQAGPAERQSHRPGWPHGRAAPALQPRRSASPLSARLLSAAAPVRPPTQMPAPAPIPQPSDALQGMLSTCQLLRTTASLHLGSFTTNMRPHRFFVSTLWRCACAPSHALASSCSGPSVLWRAAAHAKHSLCCPHIYSLDSEERPQTRPFELYHALRCADDGSSGSIPHDPAAHIVT